MSCDRNKCYEQEYNGGSCEKCMEDAPHDYCCKLECGEHEFCKGCESRASLDGIYPCKVNDDNQIITEAK